MRNLPLYNLHIVNSDVALWTIAINLNSRNAVHHVHARGDVAKHGVIVVEVGRATYGCVGLALSGAEVFVVLLFYVVEVLIGEFSS